MAEVNDCSKRESEPRHLRQQRIPQIVVTENAPVGEPLVLGEVDVVLALDGDAHAAHRKHPTADGAEDERERRQNLMLRHVEREGPRPVWNDADRIGAAERQQL